MLAFEIFEWVIFFYGLLSLIRDLINEYTYKKINKNMKIYITLKNVEENIEYFIREIYNIKRKNQFRNITIVNLDKNSPKDVEDRLKEEDLGLRIIDYEELKENYHFRGRFWGHFPKMKKYQFWGHFYIKTCFKKGKKLLFGKCP